MNWFIIDKFLIEALKEDNFYGDITTEAIVGKSSIASVDLIAKEEGIIAGLNVFERVFTLLGNVEVKALVKDGDEVSSSQLIAKIKGNTRSILTGERVALNMLQKISGIATITNKFVKEIKGTKAKLLDTRKTTPNLRVFEKYAVKVGGGYNHRFSLSDGVLIKDNHIDAAGGIKKAIELVRNSVSFVRKIEVEVENLTGVQKALESKADIIMLDNMDIDAMKKRC